MKPGSRIPLKEAIRRYWIHLLPVPFLIPFMRCIMQYTHDSAWNMPIFFGAFFIITTFAAWPVLRYGVAMSFWHLGGLLFVFGNLVTLVFIELLLKLL